MKHLKYFVNALTHALLFFIIKKKPGQTIESSRMEDINESMHLRTVGADQHPEACPYWLTF